MAAPDLRGVADAIEAAAVKQERHAEKYKKEIERVIKLLDRAKKLGDTTDVADFKSAIEELQGDIKMYLDDARDIRKVKQLVLAGKIKQAATTAYNMDTAAREELPSRFFRLIDQGSDFSAASGYPMRAAPILRL